MSENRKTNGRDVDEAAAAWFVEFCDGQIGLEQRKAFDTWLRRSPEHIQAYLKVSEAYALLGAADAVRNADVDALIRSAAEGGNVVALDSHRERGSRPEPRSGKRAGRAGKWMAAVASLAAVGAGVMFWLVQSEQGLYTTERGEIRTITLMDGSTMHLNSRTRARVRYDDRSRGIELIQGQALFVVEKDPARPFVVRSGSVDAVAIGTTFDVDARGDQTVVAVVEGKVAVRRERLGMPASSAIGPGTEGQGYGLVLEAGEQAVVGVAGAPKVSKARLDRAGAWTRREMVLEGATLPEVVEQFNRTGLRRLVLEGEAPDSFRISGVYSSADPEGLVRFLRNQPGVVIQESGEQITIRFFQNSSYQ